MHWARGYGKWQAYGQAKTANILFAVALDARGENAGVGAFRRLPPVKSHSLCDCRFTPAVQRMGLFRSTAICPADQSGEREPLEEDRTMAIDDPFHRRARDASMRELPATWEES
jgi:hypothetical protein